MIRAPVDFMLAAGIFALLFAISAALQQDRTAWNGYVMHDETAHIVTGLMAHDYLKDPNPANPLRFAEKYYLHYPKVAIGQWPPGFYAVQAAWTYVFGASKLTLQLLMAFLCAAIGTIIFVQLRAHTGFFVALLSAAVFVVMPIVMCMSASVMTEIPITLFSLIAAVCFAKYIDTEQARWSLGFGIWAGFALLTKGSAISLALVPPLALLLHGGKWHLLRRPGLWASALVVIAMCLPWYLYAARIQDVRTTWASGFGVDYVIQSSQYYFPRVFSIAGAAITILAVFGACARRLRHEARATWASLLALVFAVVIAHLLIPSGTDYRHMTVLAAPLAILFGYGIVWFDEFRRGWGLVAAVAACVLFAFLDFKSVPKDVRGYDILAQDLAMDPELEGAVFLIVGDSTGESALTAELALQQRGFRNVILRGSKVLAHETWTGDQHVELFHTPEDLLEFLLAIPVAVIVRDEAVDARLQYPYLELVRQLVEGRPDLFEQRPAYATEVHGVSYPEGLHIYVLRDHAARPKTALDFEIANGRKRR